MTATTELNILNRALESIYFPLRGRVTEHLAENGLLCENSREARVCQFDERFLQALWNEQLFAADLKTVEGQALEVISPGTWNLEEGPDFKNAVISLDGRVLHGAIEIHRRSSDWHHHGHQGDPNYREVILHAVWSNAESRESEGCALPPCFEMQSFMDRPWHAATEVIDLETDYPYARQVGPGACVPRWAHLDDGRLRRILRIAGLARFREKAGYFQRIAVARGTSQALYELVFEALGYKANKHSFRSLAQQLKLADLKALPDALARQAALFGSAGFLPDPTRTALPRQTVGKTRQMWHAWWRLGREPVRTVWRRGSCRPFNSPERRLAAGAEIMERWGWQPERAITRIVADAKDEKEMLRSLRRELSFESEWDGLTTLQHALKQRARLIGESRQRDMLVNVILPAAWSIAGRRERSEKVEMIEAAFLRMPRLQGNRSLKEAAHRLLAPPSRFREVTCSACEQQGMLGLYKDFCLRLDNDCANCPLLSSELFEKLMPTR